MARQAPGTIVVDVARETEVEAIEQKMRELIEACHGLGRYFLGIYRVSRLRSNVFNIYRLEELLEWDHSELGMRGAPADIEEPGEIDVMDIELVISRLEELGQPVCGLERVLRRRLKATLDLKALEARTASQVAS